MTPKRRPKIWLDKPLKISQLTPLHQALIISIVRSIDYHNEQRKAPDKPINYSYRLRKTIAADLHRMNFKGRDGRPYSVDRISQLTAELEHRYHLVWRQKRFETDEETGEIRGQATRIAFYRRFGCKGLKYMRRLAQGWLDAFGGLGQFYRAKKKRTAAAASSAEGSSKPSNAVEDLVDQVAGAMAIGGIPPPKPT